MTIRDALDQVLDEAFRRQSFAPLEHLFRREEMALEDYDETVWQMARAQQRWGSVLLALAQEHGYPMFLRMGLSRRNAIS